MDRPSLMLRRLNTVLGTSLCAAILSRRSTADVLDMMTGMTEISPHLASRIEHTLRIVDLLAPHESPDIIQAWFQGLNDTLGTSPALALRDSDRDDDVERAARTYLGGGS